MNNTPFEVATAFAVSTIWLTDGEENTAPHATPSRPRYPTYPACVGSCPEPPRATNPTLFGSRTPGTFTTQLLSANRIREGFATTNPSSMSETTFCGSLMIFFTVNFHHERLPPS